MNIEIKRLSPELADDYVQFFDATPHDDLIDEHKCYCVCWCNEEYKDQDFSTAEKRRQFAYEYVRKNIIQGYLAYYEGKVVGWCNANTKANCIKCVAWRYLVDFGGYREMYNKGGFELFIDSEKGLVMRKYL